MATALTKLTFEQFQQLHPDDGKGHYSGYEYWYGEALFRGMPTWVHGFLQAIILRFLTDAGYFAAPEVELRIDPEAFPRPDVIATRAKPKGRYPSSGLDVAVEIVSDEKNLADIKRKSRKYDEWGFGAVYIVDPRNRSVYLWSNNMATPVTELATIPCLKIWEELDRLCEE